MNDLLDCSVEIAGIADSFPSDIKSFNQFTLQHTLKINGDRAGVRQILRISGRVNILNTEMIRTPEAASSEGQILTGYEALIEGEIIYKAEYLGEDPENRLHCEEFRFPFLNSIQLEGCDWNDNLITITPYIEHINIEIVSSHKLSAGILLLLTACPSMPTAFELCEIKPSDCNTFNVPDAAGGIKPFLQFNAEKTIKLENSYDRIVQILSNIIEGEITACNIVNTMKGLSAGGQRLTGKAASIEIKYRYKILYEDSHSILHGIEGCFYRNTYTVIPAIMEGTDSESLIKSGLLKPKLIINNKIIKLFDSCKIYLNIDSLVELNLSPTYQLCYCASGSSTTSDLYISYEDGSRNIAVIKERNSKTIKPSWSPGGLFIAYLNDSEGKYLLNVINLKTGKLIKVRSNNDFESISSFCWFRDGRNIVFTGSRKNIKELYSIDIYTLRHKQLTFGKDLVKSYNPKVSPDGRKIIYLKSTAQVQSFWCMDINGTNNVKIAAPQGIKDYDWYGDNLTITCIYVGEEKPDTLCLINTETSTSTTLLYSNKIYSIKKLRFSPDGKYIGFIGTSISTDNIYAYDMDAKKLINLTDNKSALSINDFVWKIDSGKIYYVCCDLSFESIYSLSIHNKSKRQIINTSFSGLQLSYRPKIQ